MPVMMVIVCLGLGMIFMAVATVRMARDGSLEAFKRGFDAGLKSKPGVLERRLGELIEENEDLKLKLIAAKKLADGELLEWAAFAKRSQSKELQDGLRQVPASQFQTCPECDEDWGEHKPGCTTEAHEKAISRPLPRSKS